MDVIVLVLGLPPINIDNSSHMLWHVLDQGLLPRFKSHAIALAHLVLVTSGANETSRGSS